MKIRQELAAPEAVSEAIPELEFDQTVNLRAEAGHDRLLHNAGVVAEPIPELEFDQTLGWKSVLQKWHMRWSVERCGSDAGAVW